jgi:hypothetical protein
MPELPYLWRLYRLPPAQYANVSRIIKIGTLRRINRSGQCAVRHVMQALRRPHSPNRSRDTSVALVMVVHLDRTGACPLEAVLVHARLARLVWSYHLPMTFHGREQCSSQRRSTVTSGSVTELPSQNPSKCPRSRCCNGSRTCSRPKRLRTKIHFSNHDFSDCTYQVEYTRPGMSPEHMLPPPYRIFTPAFGSSGSRYW